MKIEFKEGDDQIELNDEDFDAPGWIKIIITNELFDTKKKPGAQLVTERTTFELHVNDLLPAVIAFNEKYKQNNK